MGVRVTMFTLLVDDYDRGIAFYRDAIGLQLIEDTDMGGGKRWVVLDGGGVRLLLAQAANEAQRAAIGRQTGGLIAGLSEATRGG